MGKKSKRRENKEKKQIELKYCFHVVIIKYCIKEILIM